MINAARTPFLEQTLMLKDIVGVCQEFKKHHLTWPRQASTAEEFKEARIFGVTGAELNRILRSGSNGLSDDPEYQALKRLLMRNFYNSGIRGPDLSALDPEVRLKLTDAETDQLIDSVQLSLKKVGSVPELGQSMWLSLPSDLHDRLYESAGIGPLNNRSCSFRASVPPTDEILNYIGDIGMVYGNSPATVGDEYFFVLDERNNLRIKYSRILGSRFVNELSSRMIERLERRLGEQLRAEVLANPKKFADLVKPATLQDELAILIAKDGVVILPSRPLTHFAEIKRLLELAGGVYLSTKNEKGFRFDAGIDCAAVLAQIASGESVNFKQQFQFFATSKIEALGVCEAAGPLKGRRVLEPSAGSGAIADVAREMGAKEVVTIEAWNVNAIKLRAKGYDPLERDFLTVSPAEIGLFDAIIANPPFTKNLDIDHVMHMFSFLKPAGSLSVIMSRGWLTGTHKKHVAFRDFLKTQDVVTNAIKAGAFKESGTGIGTVRLDFTNYQVPVDGVHPHEESIVRECEVEEEEEEEAEAQTMA